MFMMTIPTNVQQTSCNIAKCSFYHILLWHELLLLLLLFKAFTNADIVHLNKKGKIPMKKYRTSIREDKQLIEHQIA